MALAITTRMQISICSSATGPLPRTNSRRAARAPVAQQRRWYFLGRQRPDADYRQHHRRIGDYTFHATFADIDNDGDPDLLVVADNTTSQVLINDGDLGGGLVHFQVCHRSGRDYDDAGMGSSVADFDNDGDLDWFVTSISLGDSDTDRPTEADQRRI